MSSAGNKTSYSPAQSRCRQAGVPTRFGLDRAKAGQSLELPGRARSENAPSLSVSHALASILPALTEQLKQQHEQIYEVEIERQRTEHGFLPAISSVSDSRYIS